MSASPDRPEGRPLPSPESLARGRAFAELVEVIARLRAPDGCAWDRAQTLESLERHLVEETFELVDAIRSGDSAHHREELGDLLMQVVLQARIREEAGAFDVADAARDIADKLVRRHPHVFAEPGAPAPDWHALKAAEKGERDSVLDGVPRSAPALVRAQRIGEKAARVGFDWPDVAGPLDKLDEEQLELRRAVEGGRREEIEDELGDVLFSVVNLARALGIEAEAALDGAVRKFERRFRGVERRATAAGRRLEAMDLDAMEALWQAEKADEGAPGRQPEVGPPER